MPKYCIVVLLDSDTSCRSTVQLYYSTLTRRVEVLYSCTTQFRRSGRGLRTRVRINSDTLSTTPHPIPLQPTNPPMQISTDWHLENSRTAMWRRRDAPIDRIVIDPTIVVAMAFYEHMRVDLISAFADSQILVPTTISADLMNMGAEAVSSGHLDQNEVVSMLGFLAELPVRTINPLPENWIELQTTESMCKRHVPYLAVAIQHLGTVMTFDQHLIGACRRLRIPRMRFSALHRLQWKPNLNRAHSMEPSS